MDSHCEFNVAVSPLSPISIIEWFSLHASAMAVNYMAR